MVVIIFSFSSLLFLVEDNQFAYHSSFLVSLNGTKDFIGSRFHSGKLQDGCISCPGKKMQIILGRITRLMMHGGAAVACFNIGYLYFVDHKIMLDRPCILKCQSYGLTSGNGY